MDQNNQTNAQGQNNAAFTQNMNTLFSNLEDFTRNESVLGKPLTVGDKTIIPVVSVTLGYGSGNSAMKGGQQGQQGQQAQQAQQNITGGNMGMNTGMGALGLGAKINTEAVVVIDKDNVSMLPVNEKSNMGQLMEKLPQMLSSLNLGGQQGQQGQQKQQGQQAQQGQQGQQGQKQ